MKKILFSVICIISSINYVKSMSTASNNLRVILPHHSTPISVNKIVTSDFQEMTQDERNSLKLALSSILKMISPNISFQNTSKIAVDDDSKFDDESLTENDAVNAVGSVRARLYDLLHTETNEIESLINLSVSTLKDVKNAGFINVFGYRYCLGVLLINFSSYLSDEDYKALFDDSKFSDPARIGISLLEEAAKTKKEGGDDDKGAFDYLEKRVQQ